MANPKKKTEIRVVDTLKIEDWKNNKSLQLELERALDLPVMKKAITTLLSAVMPNATPSPAMEPGLSPDMVMLRNNNLYHNRSGFNQAFKALRNLTKLKNDPNKPITPWGLLEPEDE